MTSFHTASFLQPPGLPIEVSDVAPRSPQAVPFLPPLSPIQNVVPDRSWMFISRYRSLDSLLVPGSKPVIIGYRDFMATKRSANGNGTADRGLAGLVGSESLSSSLYNTGPRASPPVLHLPHDLISDHASTVDSADLGTPISRLHPPSSGRHVYDTEPFSPDVVTPTAYSPPMASRHVEKWRAGAPTAVLMPSDHPMIQSQAPAEARTPKFLSVYEPPLFSDGPDLRLAGRRSSRDHTATEDYFRVRRSSYQSNGTSPSREPTGSLQRASIGTASAGRFLGIVVRFFLLPLLSVTHLISRALVDSSARGIEAGRVFVAVDDAAKFELVFPDSYINRAVLYLWNLAVFTVFFVPLTIIRSVARAANAMRKLPHAVSRAVVSRIENSDGPWRQFVDPLIYAHTLQEKLSGVWRAWERYAWKDL